MSASSDENDQTQLSHTSTMRTSVPEHDVEGQDFSQYSSRKKPWRLNVTDFNTIVKHKYEGKGTAQEPYLVTWLPGATDPENPQQFSEAHKWSLTFLVSIATLCVSLSSSAYSGATKSIKAELGGSQTVITLGISLFVVGFMVGPLVAAPASELIGRRNVFLITYALMTVFLAVGAAAQTLAQLLVFRFFAGLMGSSPLSNAAGTIADCFSARQRGLAMALFAAAPFLGPALGPICGGFLGQSAGFRWVQGFLGIFGGVVTVAGFFILSETYAPLLLRQRAAKLSQATGKEYISQLDAGKEKTSFARQFLVSLGRPWLLLIHEPIVLLLSLYTAIVYAILYSFFSAFPIVFGQVRGWDEGSVGLSFCGIIIGMVVAIAAVILYYNPNYIKEVDKHGGITAPPEVRLKSALVGAPLLVIGLAGFAATDFPSIHWVAPIACSIPFAVGMILVFLALQNYLVDAYLLYAASVLAANSVIRSLFGAAFPLFTPYMYNPGGVNGKCPVESCGIHVGPGIAAAIALIFLPAPFVFYRYGATIRKRCKYSAEADKLLQRMLESAKMRDVDEKSADDDAGIEQREKDAGQELVDEQAGIDKRNERSTTSRDQKSSRHQPSYQEGINLSQQYSHHSVF